jgi:hypothetical protein
MWTPTTRQHHSHPVTRYQTDLTVRTSVLQDAAKQAGATAKR